MITKHDIKDAISAIELRKIINRAYDFHRDYYYIKMDIRNAYNCAMYGKPDRIVPISWRWMRSHGLRLSAFSGDVIKDFCNIRVTCGVLDWFGEELKRGVLFSIEGESK